jgi:hypothetical protein
MLPSGDYRMSTEESVNSLVFTASEVKAFYAGVSAGEFTPKRALAT